MDNYIIMCRSITHAQRAARLLERANIGAYIVKAPQGLSPEGCSYGLRIAGRNRHRATEILKMSGLRFGRVFRLLDDGSASEVDA